MSQSGRAHSPVAAERTKVGEGQGKTGWHGAGQGFQIVLSGITTRTGARREVPAGPLEEARLAGC